MMTSLALSRLALLSLLSPLLQNFAQTVYPSHPAASIDDNISAIKPYRDDPESTSSSFGVSLRRTAENSPVMEFEMHPIVNRQPKTSAITNTIKGHQPKLLLIVFVLMVGGYAISRHKPSNKVQHGLQHQQPQIRWQQVQTHQQVHSVDVEYHSICLIHPLGLLPTHHRTTRKNTNRLILLQTLLY